MDFCGIKWSLVGFLLMNLSAPLFDIFAGMCKAEFTGRLAEVGHVQGQVKHNDGPKGSYVASGQAPVGIR